MEAYIAGVYFSHPADKRISIAMPILQDWLREMYDPLFDFFYTYMKNEHDQHQNAVGADDEGAVIVMDEEEVNRVNAAAMGMLPLVKMYAETYERELTWEEDRFDTTIGTLYRIRCIVDGMELGEATRSARKDARNVAAWEAAKKLGLTVSWVPCVDLNQLIPEPSHMISRKDLIFRAEASLNKSLQRQNAKWERGRMMIQRDNEYITTRNLTISRL
jgi:hypothetical protein